MSFTFLIIVGVKPKIEADMEKDQIFPRTRFVNNQNFRKKYISKFLTITRIIVEIIIYRL